MDLKENYFSIKKKTGAANCKLIVVTKNHSAQEIMELISLGHRDFGENRVQELEGKAKELEGKEINWHFIGHLQGNKAKKAVELCKVIHSVDSVKLAKKIDSAAAELGKKQKILAEVNVSGESAKYGITPGELKNFINETKKLGSIELLGLMTMAPWIDAKKTRPYFQQLRELAKKFGLNELSMGMSNDFEVALEEGATIVRVGSAIFGKK